MYRRFCQGAGHCATFILIIVGSAIRAAFESLVTSQNMTQILAVPVSLLVRSFRLTNSPTMFDDKLILNSRCVRDVIFVSASLDYCKSRELSCKCLDSVIKLSWQLVYVQCRREMIRESWDLKRRRHETKVNRRGFINSSLNIDFHYEIIFIDTPFRWQCSNRCFQEVCVIEQKCNANLAFDEDETEWNHGRSFQWSVIYS